MTSLVRNFTIGTLLLLFLFFYLVLEKGRSSVYRESQIEALSEVTRLPGVSLATPYLENRMFYYDDFSNYIYLDMASYRYMDFVYAQ